MAKISKSTEKQTQLAAKAKDLCRDWPVGESRGLHPSFHKSMWEKWNAAVMLGLLLKDSTPDQGGYYRFMRLAKSVD
jgi:hypothetical protein